MKRKNQVDEIVATTKRLKIKENGEYIEKGCIGIHWRKKVEELLAP